MAEQLVDTPSMASERAVFQSITVGIGLLMIFIPLVLPSPQHNSFVLLTLLAAGAFLVYLGASPFVKLQWHKRNVGKFVKFDASYNRILPQESPLYWTGLIIGCFEQYNKIHYILTAFLSEEIRMCPASVTMETVEIDVEEMLTCKNPAIRSHGLRLLGNRSRQLLEKKQLRELWHLLFQRQLISCDEFEERTREFGI